MFSWGLIIAACIFLAAIGPYADTYWIDDDHREWLRVKLIALYDLIENVHITGFILLMARVLSGRIATIIYLLLSSITFVAYMYFIYRTIIEETSRHPLPAPFDQLTFPNPVQVVIFSWLCMLPSTFIFTWAVRQFPNALLLRQRFKVAPFSYWYCILHC